MLKLNKIAHTILIVDDSEDFRFIVSEHLSEAGYQTIQACNGLEALSYLFAKQMSDKPSAIVLDLSMPVMNGSVFLKEKRQNIGISDIPVILFSSDTALNEVARQDASVVLALPKTTQANALLLAAQIAVSKSELQQLLKNELKNINHQ